MNPEAQVECWYVAKNEQVLGPFSEDELTEKLLNRELRWLDLAICRSGNMICGGWQILEQVPVFRRRSGRANNPLAEIEEQWVFSLQGAKEMQGPWSLLEARERLYAGSLSFDDLAWRIGMKTWGRVGDLTEFSSSPRETNLCVLGPSTPLEDSLTELQTQIQKQVSNEDLLSSVVQIGQLSQMRKLSSTAESQRPEEAVGDDLVAIPDWMRVLGGSGFFSVIGPLILAIFSAPAWAADSLEIVPMKLASEQPVLVLQTNAKIDEAITVTISGLSGEILTLLSYNRTISVARKAGEIPTLHLSELALPQGRYKVEAVLGDLRHSASIFLGTNDAQFAEALEQHRKMISGVQQLEKKTIFYSARNLTALAVGLEKSLNIKAQAKWKESYAKWRAEIRAAEAPLAKLLKATKPNQRAYPEKIEELKKAFDQLRSWADESNLAIKEPRQGARDIASQDSVAGRLASQAQMVKSLRTQSLQPLVKSAATLSSTSGSGSQGRDESE